MKPKFITESTNVWIKERYISNINLVFLRETGWGEKLFDQGHSIKAIFCIFATIGPRWTLHSHVVQPSALRQKYIIETWESVLFVETPLEKIIPRLLYNLWVFLLWLFKIHMVFWSPEVPLREMNNKVLRQISPPLRRSLIRCLESTLKYVTGRGLHNLNQLKKKKAKHQIISILK